MFKINSIVFDIKRKCSKRFSPYDNLCIDERLLVFKDRLPLNQYIHPKRNRYGIKLFVICDYLTGYVLDLIIYPVSTIQIIRSLKFGISGSIVSDINLKLS